MIFMKIRKKKRRESGFSDRGILSSEYRIPNQNESECSETRLKSAESEFHQALIFYFTRKIRLREFFKVERGAFSKMG